MKWYRKALRGAVIALFICLILLHVLRGPPRSVSMHTGGGGGGKGSSSSSSSSSSGVASRGMTQVISSQFIGGGSGGGGGSGSGSGGSGRGGGSGVRASGKPYKPRVRPILYPSFVFAQWSPEGYQTYLWTDGFLKDGTLTIITQCYQGLPRSYENIRLLSPHFPGGEARFTTIHVRDAYESVVMARYENPELLAGLDRLELEVKYEAHGVAQNVTVLRAPGGWESSFAMCALFLQDRHLLRMWTHYWYLLGVDTFYLYWNGEVSEIPALRDLMEDLPAHVVFIHWPYDYWIPNKERPHHGQPQAWNSCYQRNKDKHDFLVFYDLDELLVFANVTDLATYYNALPRPWVAMRTWSAWARIDLDALSVPFDELELHHLHTLPLYRAPPHYSREKYVLNASSGVHVINVHGVYQTTTGLGFPGQPLKPDAAPDAPWPELQLLQDPSLAYHFHFTNVGRDRGRNKRVTDEVADSRVQTTLWSQLNSTRGKVLRAKMAAVEQWRNDNPEKKLKRKKADPSKPEGTVCINCG